MRKLDFFQLTRPVQERFVAATKGTDTPEPLLALPGSVPFPTGWLVGALASFAGLLAVLAAGYGNLTSRWALVPPWFGAIYAGCAAGMTLCLLRVAATLKRRSALPFRPGIFLFPVGVVNARGPQLRVHPLSDLSEVRSARSTRQVRLDFSTGDSYQFPLAESAQFDQLRETIIQAQHHLSKIEASQDEHELVALDPLRDSGIPNPFLPDEPIRLVVPRWVRWTVVLALLIGGGLGALLWRTRNALSERRLLAAAKQENTVSSYRAYLAAGGQRASVSQILLPRAQLEEARQAGTVEAIQRFLDQHPETRIRDEAVAALRAALMAELAKAQRTGTVTALRELAKRPLYQQLIGPQLQAAIHAAFERALGAFRARAATGNRQLLPFVQRLLSFAEEQHGAEVMVRFRRLATQGAERSDSVVRESPYYSGKEALPSQYFEDDHARKFEQSASKLIIRELQAAFATDVLRFSLGPPVPTGQKPPEKPKVPTLLIAHRATLAGTYFSDRPPRVLVAAAFEFMATLTIPGNPNPLKFDKISSWQPPDMKVVRRDSLLPNAVYESLAKGGFQQLEQELLAKLLKQPAEPPEQPP